MSSTLLKQHQANFLKRPNLSGVALILLLTDEFGTEFYDWEPETLRDEIKNTWGVTLPDPVMERVWAVLTILTTDKFETSFDAFLHVCNALAGFGADFDQYDLVSINEAAKTIAEITLIDPPEDGFRFNSEIRTYLGQQSEMEGYDRPPQILEPFIDTVTPTTNPLPFDENEFKSYHDRQASKHEILNMEVRAHLLNIVEELKDLKLANGNTQSLQQFIQKTQKQLSA